MLILPPGHNRSLSTPGRLRKRERWMIGGVSGLCAVLVVVVILAVAGTGGGLRRGCFSVTFASSLGGQPISACGAQARALCTSIGTPSGYSGSVGDRLAVQCRRLKLKVGS